MDDAFTAWVDESGSNTRDDPGTYIMAAAITTPRQCEPTRLAMAGLLLPGQVKLHWRDEQSRRQAQITETLGALDIEHLVVVTSPHGVHTTSERRRRLTLGVLFPELGDLGVDHVILESRGPKDDQRDRQMLDYLRQRRLLNSTMRIDHQVGRDEPLLWIPDALCGMVTARRCGEPELFETLASKITFIERAP